uniref:PAR1 protein n=1 Tax=Cannabis sativa TaxID=3483 RepID=A0A803PQD6_CANSA
MAAKFFLKALSIIALTFALCLQGTLGGVTCEELEQDTCAFAVSSVGKRCVLEKHVKRSGEEAYTCRTSDIEADKLKDIIETDHCIKACGLDRKTLGISSDSLLESHFTNQLCSPSCHNSCPNVVDLYFNLAAGEGVFLPKLCEAQAGNDARRGMAEIKSSGFVVAQGPGVQPARLIAATAPIISPALPPY